MGKRKRKSATNVDAAPAAVTPATKVDAVPAAVTLPSKSAKKRARRREKEVASITKWKPASKVDAAPAAVTQPTKTKKRARKRAKKAVQKEVAGSQKQEIVSGGVELAVEQNTFQTEIQKEQTNFPDVRLAEQNKVDAAPAAVTQPTKAKQIGREWAKKAVQKEIVGSQKQEIVNGGMELAVEENTFETAQKEQTSFSEVRVAEEEQSKGTGSGHVEFTMPEAAQEALRLNNATEKGACPPTLSKTVCLSNLSDSIEEDDIENFFKVIGEVAEVRFAMRGDQFAGFVQVEFTTAEAAQEALKLDNSLLLDQPVKIHLLEEQGDYTSGKSDCSEEKPYQEGGQGTDIEKVDAPSLSKTALKLDNSLILDLPVKIDLLEEQGVYPSGNSEEKPYQEGGQGTNIEKPQATGSKTLFMGNLSLSIKKNDVKNFFKDVGEIADIHLSYKEGRIAHFGHVTFTTPEAALEALKLNNTELVGRRVRLEFASGRDPPVKLGLARERSAQHPTMPRTTEFKTKTLYLGNLSSSVKEDDVKNFFKDVGEVAKVLFVFDGGPVGFGWVKFTTTQAAHEALKLNNKLLLDRPVKLDLAREQGASTSGNSNEKSYQKRNEGGTAYIHGFNPSESVDDIRRNLEEHFRMCGKITGLSIPKDVTGAAEGIAIMKFKDLEGLKYALALNGSVVGGYTIFVQEAKLLRGEGRGRRGG